MKKGITFVLALVICLSLCACGHQHSWKNATCTEPKTCTKCGETEGSALGHSWEKATCTEPKTCSRCGITEGSALGHSWKKQTDTTPKMCTKCGVMEPMPLPKTGTVFLGNNLLKSSEITIRTSDESAYIKLKNVKNEDVFSFFVRANSTTTVEIPSGMFYVYFACGDEWFGTKYCFGDSTSYSKDSELLDFSRYTYTYTLYKVTNGNFSETPVSEDEFN